MKESMMILVGDEGDSSFFFSKEFSNFSGLKEYLIVFYLLFFNSQIYTIVFFIFCCFILKEKRNS